MEDGCCSDTSDHDETQQQGGVSVRFYTIKLPRFLSGIVKAMMNAFQKEK